MVWIDLSRRLLFLQELVDVPFRHLLKPSTKFEWIEELEECFDESKKKIIGLIEDWCKDGIGWSLQQKYCKCDAITLI